MNETLEVREALWNSVIALSDEQLNRQVKAGKWTIMQVLVHLHLMEEMIAGKLADALAREENNPTDPKPIRITLDRSRRIESPGYLKPSADFRTLASIQDKLDRSRRTVLDTLEGVPQDTLIQKSFHHPVFGLMDARQWVEFIGVHEMRHLAQIEDLKQEL